MTPPQQTRRAARWAVPGYALALSLLVTAPLLAPGYLLLRDAVSTPRSYLSDAALGLGESAPRAVPQDVALAVASSVVDGGLVVKALLITGLLLAGWGAARLARQVLPETGVAGQLVAATVAVWNPFVAERLLQGHWSLLVGYGCLPWVAGAVLRLRTDGPAAGAWAAMVFFVALAGLTPTGVLLAAVVGLVCVAAPGPGVGRVRCAVPVLAAAVVTAGPWLAASVLGGALRSPQDSGLAPFAARAEPFLGTLGSLAGLGGIWNAEAVPQSRATPWAVAGTVVLLSVVACGIPALLRRRVATPLLALAAVSVALPAAMATGPGLALLRAGTEAAPGLAMLRDGQKWVALAMPGYALAGAGAVLLLRRWLPPAVAALLCCSAVLAGLPDLAWGVGGEVRSVHYPAGWHQVADRINADPQPVAVLPVESMRRFGWAGHAPVLDPLPRWVHAEVLSTGDLLVGGRTVLGEGGRARQVQRLLLSGADPAALREAGVGWVVLETGTPGTTGSAEATLRRLPVVYRDADLTLYRVGGLGRQWSAPQWKRGAVLAAHLLWGGLLVGGAAVLARTGLVRSGLVRSRR
ncbi:MAG: hypothetical protein KDB56_01025 [Mycobacterium sp.]|nr:hypothetical protein [Mycobacterium sp.]